MTNEMIATIEAARECSYCNECAVYLMSNGTNLLYAHNDEQRESWKEVGYWVAMIFENGNRVEA